MFDLNDTNWERLKGYVTELRVDSRWILKGNNDNKPYGSLRIASHPDLPAGYLRAIFTYVTTIKSKTREDIIQTVEDYQIEMKELELYSLEEDVETETKTIEAPYKELESIFDVKIF